MAEVSLLGILSRWVHILAVVIAVGGSFFIRLILLPMAQKSLSAEAHESLRTNLLGRWRIVIHSCIFLLLLTGFYNLWLAMQSDPEPVYHLLFAAKFLLSLMLFAIAILVTAKQGMPTWMQPHARHWMLGLVALGITIILIAGLLHTIPRGI